MRRSRLARRLHAIAYGWRIDWPKGSDMSYSAQIVIACILPFSLAAFGVVVFFACYGIVDIFRGE